MKMESKGACLLVLYVLCLAGYTLSEPAAEPKPESLANAESQDRYVKDQVDSALVPLYDMANFFINSMVQPRYLTYMEEKGADLSSFEATWNHIKENWNEWVLYAIGFTVCFAVGVVLFITMLLVAMIVPCCRCCGNCGGKISPMEAKNAKSQRVGCGITLFIITCILILGVVCMFTLNIRFKQMLQGDESIFDSIGNTMTEVESFLNKTTGEVNDTALGGYINTKDQVFKRLDDIPGDSLDTIDTGTKVLSNFRDLATFVDTLPSINTSLTDASIELDKVNQQNIEFNTSLHSIVINLVNSIAGCVDECQNVSNSLELLTAAADFNNITLTIEVSKVIVDEIVAQGNITSEILRINSSLDSLEQEIADAIQPTLEDAKEVAEGIQVEIQDLIHRLQETVEDINLGSLKTTMDNIKEDTEWPTDIMYWSIFGLALTLAMVCLCNLVGLFHDVVCPRKKPEAGCCSSDKAMGADWLLAGVGFTLFFYWIYTIIVMVFFITGGALQSEACRHIVNYNNTDSREVLGIYENWMAQQLDDFNISVIDTYKKCEQDMAVYTAFELEDQYNITEILNLDDVKNAMEEIKNSGITVDPIEIMSGTLGDILLELDEALTLDFDSMYDELNLPLTTVNIESLVNDLLSIQNETGVNTDDLVDGITELQYLYGNASDEMNTTKSAAMGYLQITELILGGISIGNITIALNMSEDALNTNGTAIAQGFVNDTADDVYDYIKNFADDTEDDVRHEIGRCKPVYDSLTDTIDAGCVRALWPINGFWFSLGWCLFFLIPSIILSFKLATLYRKTLPYKSGSQRDDDHMYDAFKSSNGYSTGGDQSTDMLLTPVGHHQRGGGMYAADNPVYMGDNNMQMQFHLPRPQMVPAKPQSYNTFASPMHVSPGHHQNHYSPPPKYKASMMEPERDYESGM